MSKVTTTEVVDFVSKMLFNYKQECQEQHKDKSYASDDFVNRMALSYTVGVLQTMLELSINDPTYTERLVERIKTNTP